MYQASDEEYRQRLRAKLSEEVEEFLQADEASALDELADVLEVVLALEAEAPAHRVQGPYYRPTAPGR